MNALEEIACKYGSQKIEDKFDRRDAIVEYNRRERKIQMEKDARKVARRQSADSARAAKFAKKERVVNPKETAPRKESPAAQVPSEYELYLEWQAARRRLGK
jgi:hypothetical protein